METVCLEICSPGVEVLARRLLPLIILLFRVKLSENIKLFTTYEIPIRLSAACVQINLFNNNLPTPLERTSSSGD